jgi:hypothetical protein
MRKTNQNSSLIIRPKHPQKQTEGKAPVSTSKKNIKPKKAKPDVAQKENRSLSGFEDRPAYKLTTPKKPVHRAKPKERSKSLLCERKEGAVHELPLNQSHRQALLEYLKVRGEKEETDISGHIHSIRYDKAYAEAETHSNFFSPCPPKADDAAFMRSDLQISAQPAPLPQF